MLTDQIDGGGPVTAGHGTVTDRDYAPVFDFFEAGQVSDEHDVRSVANSCDNRGYAPVSPGDRGSDNLFVLKLADDSMASSAAHTGVTFQITDEIVVDTSADIEPGDFVVAKRDADDVAVFRQYQVREIDDTTGRVTAALVPLNESYPTLTIVPGVNGRVIGRMVRRTSRF